jgi:hypothetical protein
VISKLPASVRTVIATAFLLGVAHYSAVRADTLDGWQPTEGKWSAQNSILVADGAYSVLLQAKSQPQDFQINAEVGYSSTAPQAAAGVIFRYNPDDQTGYVACLRDVEKGIDPKFGEWNRPVLQLFRLDRDGWRFLQESKVPDCWGDRLHPLRVICNGPDIAVFYEDMSTAVIRQYDPTYQRIGSAGFWKDQLGVGRYDKFEIGPVRDAPPAASRIDWSWVRGAVYVRSDAVNAVQMWEEYWDHTDVLDRELSFAHLYGFNMVQVYLHWIVWDKHHEEYCKRIDDFLTRAAKYHLKVNFIFWDDCGNVDPSLTFNGPVPGRHNSQMMPNPSHAIRDSEAELTAHGEQFGQYVRGIASQFKSDPRISFWQIYNECMGPREQYHQGVADANLNRLLGWTRDWIKQTGSQIPITATGGGFYGAKYSDFYTYHSYRFGKDPLPNADGGSAHLCTETLDRPDANLLDCLTGFVGKNNGFVVWDLMIGRDNCRFPWGHPDGSNEPSSPFHGVIYPDGHPWDIREVRALLGDNDFAALSDHLFKVEYFNDDTFTKLIKTSVTPRIDFTLPHEPGSGSPDPCAGIGADRFSMRWTTRLTAPASGSFSFFTHADGSIRVTIDGKAIVLSTPGQPDSQGAISLTLGQKYAIEVAYAHHDAVAPDVHLSWSGPGMEKCVFLPEAN